MNELTAFSFTAKNLHDDAADSLAMLAGICQKDRRWSRWQRDRFNTNTPDFSGVFWSVRILHQSSCSEWWR